jgi:polygalacturonase
VAIGDAKNVVISNNLCISGHGISIGAIRTGHVVDTVLIEGNTIVSSYNGMPPPEDVFSG